MEAAQKRLGEVRFREIANKARAETLGEIVATVLAWEFDGSEK